MKHSKVTAFFYMTIALYLIAAALFLFQDGGNDTDRLGAAEPLPAEQTDRSFDLLAEKADHEEIIYYPLDPQPGDFVIIEAGPVRWLDQAELSYSFGGVSSEHYLVGRLLYAIIAIDPDTEQGRHTITISNNDQAVERSFSAELTIVDKEFPLSRFSMPAARTEGWTAARLAEDREKMRLARATTEPQPLWQDNFMLPTEGRITSEYGAVRIINNNPPRRHAGLDIGAPEGTPVYAPNSGLVRLAEFLLSGGNTIIIDHGIGLSSTYMHLHSIDISAGDFVTQGQQIGTVGMTGYATGPHLHWEVNIGQTAVNPEQLLDNDLLWIAPAYVQQWISAQE